MEQYVQVLQALYDVFDRCEAMNRREWIDADLKAWENEKSVRHFLLGYRGQGILGDTYLSQKNHHRVTNQQEPWVNALYKTLGGIGLSLAHQYDRKDASPSLDHLTVKPPSTKMQGWGCRSCGHAEWTLQMIEHFIARNTIETLVVEALKQNRLPECVEQIFAVDIPGLQEERAKWKNLAEASGIAVTNHREWLRVCPRCQRKDTAVTRWNLKKGLFGQVKWVRDKGNLPLN